MLEAWGVNMAWALVIAALGVVLLASKSAGASTFSLPTSLLPGGSPSGSSTPTGGGSSGSPSGSSGSLGGAPVLSCAITNDPSTWPTGDEFWNVCWAIAYAEGAQIAGSVPDRCNNPGDISDGATD